MKILDKCRMEIVMQRGRKLISFLLCFAMVWGLLSSVLVTASATNTEQEEATADVGTEASASSPLTTSKLEGAVTGTTKEYP